MIHAAFVFDGLGTLYTTRVAPNTLGLVHGITTGTGAFQRARGQCDI